MTASKPMPWANWPENVRVYIDRRLDVYGSGLKGRNAAVRDVQTTLLRAVNATLAANKRRLVFAPLKALRATPEGAFVWSSRAVDVSPWLVNPPTYPVILTTDLRGIKTHLDAPALRDSYLDARRLDHVHEALHDAVLVAVQSLAP